MKTKQISYLLVAVVLLTLNASCEKWLDVQPNSQVKSSELLSTEQGYKEALAGIYTLLTDNSLYGKELTYGMHGVLSHEWKNYPLAYADDAQYDYEATLSQGRIEGVWSKMYNAISNTNYLLENIDNSQVFNGRNYEIIKGEALALRGFIHFDLLRTFGVSYVLNPNQQAIPYVTQYSAKQTAQSTVQVVVDKIIEDLLAAKELLKYDPIYTGEVINEFNDNGYLLNRQLHLNYYAVEALLARIYLYIGKYDLAEIAANNVIQANKFAFVSQASFASGVDPSGASEQIFGLQLNTLSLNNTNFLSDEGTTTFSLDQASKSLYISSTDDYRSYLFINGTTTNTLNNIYTLKYAKTTDDSYYLNKIPVIKLSEMYLILAESLWSQDKDPLPALNRQRNARGLSALTVLPTDVRTLFTNEYRIEFLGEGQLFYYYKRINQEIIHGATTNLVNSKGYTFPIPPNEITSADRQPNR